MWHIRLVYRSFQKLRILRPWYPVKEGRFTEGTFLDGMAWNMQVGDSAYFKNEGCRWRKMFSIVAWRGRPYLSFGYCWGRRKCRWPLLTTPYYPSLMHGGRIRSKYMKDMGGPSAEIPVRKDLEGYWWDTSGDHPILNFNVKEMRSRVHWKYKVFLPSLNEDIANASAAS